jgi:murein L,D-transpeptidase YafK
MLIVFGFRIFSYKHQEEERSDISSQSQPYKHQEEERSDIPSPSQSRSDGAGSLAPQDETDDLWEGPILYRLGSGPSASMDLILIEKDLQKLSLYRYDGTYALVKTYRCVTGKQRGDKEKELDDKTPEGIYFNNKTFRDNEITIFGDRAFGLTYPDIFDDLDGKGGSGIFVHGSNREIKSYSTNGCLVLDNLDLADLDKRIRFEATPVIIGKRLPYRFADAKRDLAAVIPIIKKAMVPKAHINKEITFDQFAVLGYRDQVVAMGKISENKPKGISGFSRAYLSDLGEDLLVLLKREWSPIRQYVAKAKPRTQPASSSGKGEITSLVASWKSAWEKERLNDYISHYHSRFMDKGKNRSAWKSYKARLNKRYKKISVKITNLKVKVNGKKADAYFKQRYQTESYAAEGYKRLELRKEGKSWKIYRERPYKSKPAGWPS